MIAIDGPSGAGKSTVAKRLAARLGYLFLDTGAMYRAVALAVLEQKVNPLDADGVARLLPRIQIHFSGDGTRVFLSLDSEVARDVTEAIREQPVTDIVSDVAAHASVREKLTDEQRRIARGRSVVAEGRDTTTVVFNDADHKFFLTASLKERARRRRTERPELADKSLEEVIADIERRDSKDRSRPLAPLTEAAGVIRIDTTGLGADRIVDALVDHCRRRDEERP